MMTRCVGSYQLIGGQKLAVCLEPSKKNVNLKVKLLWWLFYLEMFTFYIHFFDYLSPNKMNEYQFNIWTKFLESWT